MIDLGSISSFYTAYEGSWFWEYVNNSSLLKGKNGDWGIVEITLKDGEEIPFLKILELEKEVETYLVGIDTSKLKLAALMQIAEDVVSGKAVSISEEQFLEIYEEVNGDE